MAGRPSFKLTSGMEDFALDISGPDGCGFVESSWFDGYTYRYFWGDINIHIYREDGDYKVAGTDRGSRDLKASVSSPSLELTERWLLIEIGSMYRSLMCLPDIVLPSSRDKVKVGYEMVKVSQYGCSLQSLGGDILPVILSDSRVRSFRTVKYSHIVDLPLPGLIESYRSETGAPFLRDYVVPRGEG